MILNDIDFPNQIVDAIKNNYLVVFAGAGVSMEKPTSLPGFGELVEKIAEGTGKKYNKRESCEVFLGALKTNGIDVNQLAAEILSNTCLHYNKLHEAIVELFHSHDNIKIVTTNYDQMFEQVIESKNINSPVYNIPALPMGNDVEGIIHIHGNVDNAKYMVLTDEDFGRAYMTEGYVSRFLVQLFNSYTVLFIGYSYNDTILWYLTRAMSRQINKKIYILTDDNQSNWSALGIEPVYYPQKSYAVMRKGLIRLGKISKKRLVDWKIDLKKMSEKPSTDFVVNNEINYCLEDKYVCKIMVDVVQGREWLELFEKNNIFSVCFSQDEKYTEKAILWGKWLCDKFVGKDDEALLLLISRNNNIINKYFADGLIRKIIYSEDINIKFLMAYVLVLDKHIVDSMSIDRLIYILASKKQYYFAFSLFKKYFNFSMKVEKNSWSSSNEVEIKHSFLGEYFYVDSSWAIIKGKVIELFPYEVITFAIEKINELHFKYLSFRDGEDRSEPLDISLFDIENKEKNYRDDLFYILNQMLLEASYSLWSQNNDLLKTMLLKTINNDSILLKRITLKIIREIAIFTPSEQLEIVLQNDFLKIILCHEQVFLLVQKFFQGLSDKEKNHLIDSIEKLGEVYDSNKVYKWCIWLQRVEPNNSRLDGIVNNILAENHYEPDDHPELLINYSHIEGIENVSPITEDKLISLSISEAVDYLINFKDNPFEVVSRHSLLRTFSLCLSKNIGWAKKIIEYLLKEHIVVSDLWKHFFYGIGDLNYKLEDVLFFIKIIKNNIDSVGDICGAARYLQKILKHPNIKNCFLENESVFFSLSELLWENREHEDGETTRLVDATLNTTVGSIIFSWISMVYLLPKKEIPEKYKQLFDKALKAQGLDKRIAICILAGHFNFLCYRDAKWSVMQLKPLLNSDEKKYFTSAWEGIVYFSNRINRNTVDIIEPIFFHAIRKIEWLEGNVAQAFIKLLLALMIYVVEKPTSKFIPEFYRYSSGKMHSDLLYSIEQQLRIMDEASKINWWNSWLKKFLENRKNNKPCLLEEEENQAITNIIPLLPEVFEEAVDVVCKGKTPQVIHGMIWKEINEKHLVKEHQHSVLKLLMWLLNDTNELSFVNDDIRDIINELTEIDVVERTKLQEMLLKKDVDIF